MEQHWLGLCWQNLAYCVDCNSFNPYNFHNFYTLIHLDKIYCIFKSQSLKYKRTYGPFWPILTNFGDNYSYIGYNGFDIKWEHWWRPFKIYHLVSTANPALCGWNWAGLVLPISWYINPPAPRIWKQFTGITFCHHSYVKRSLIPHFLCLIFSLQQVW